MSSLYCRSAGGLMWSAGRSPFTSVSKGVGIKAGANIRTEATRCSSVITSLSSVRTEAARYASAIIPFFASIQCERRYYTASSISYLPALAKASTPSSSHLAIYTRQNSTYTSARATAAEKTYSVANISANGSLSVTSLALTEILRNSSLHARDLFSLALTSSHEMEDTTMYRKRRQRGAAARTPSAILPRGNEIVLSFGSVRALIGRDRGMIFDAHSPDTKLLAAEIATVFELRTLEGRESRWRKMAGFNGQSAEFSDSHSKKNKEHHIDHGSDWSAKMRYEGEPFELVFIEEILRDTCDTFNRRLRLYEPIVDTLLVRVHHEVFSDSGVQHLVPIKDSLQEFELIVKNCLECLTHLLDNDEDMLGLLLTEQHLAKVKGTEIQPTLHERVELLLEEYARQLNNVIHEIHFLLKRIQSKQELVAISLDSYRNRMIRMNVYLAVVGVGLATSTTVAGYFGMNLVSGLEESPTAFSTTVVSTSAVTLAIFFGCLSYLSGARMQERAMERMKEIDTITGALSDMQSLDYAIKTMLNENKPMDKATFTEKLSECRPGDKIIEDEVNLLFHILDLSRDGYIYTSDFRSIESFAGHNMPHHVRLALHAKHTGKGGSEPESKKDE